MLAQPYDKYFTTENMDKKVYCSGLVFLAFQRSGFPIGGMQKIKTLDINNSIVRSLFKRRYKTHPLCERKNLEFEDCWKQVIEDKVITPDSIINDKSLELVYSNYS